MKQYIYADNAATTQLDTDAFEAMKPFLLGEFGNASQPYSFSRSAKKALKESRETIARCIGATPEEIYFTSGGTESDNWAIKGSAFSDPAKRLTLTSSIEHHAILMACKEIERLGYPVAYLPVDSSGTLQLDTLSKTITNQTRLVSVMLVNNEIGSVQDIASIADMAHSHGAIVHTDAVQAVGHMKIDVNKQGVDMLSASAHKFNGPKGIGFLYIRKGTPMRPYASGGSQEYGMRAGTENIASIVGMATALKKNCDLMMQVTEHLKVLEQQLIGTLQASGVEFIRNGSPNRISGNVSLSFPESDGEAILHRLDLMGICVSTGSACDSTNKRISHVLQAIGLEQEYARGTIRVSLGKNNTSCDVDAIASALIKILK